MILFPDITLPGLFKIWECFLYTCYIFLLHSKRFTRHDSSNQQKNLIDFAMWCHATLGPHYEQPKRLSLNSCVLLMKAVNWLLLKLLWLGFHIRRKGRERESKGKEGRESISWEFVILKSKMLFISTNLRKKLNLGKQKNKNQYHV